jgi:integrase
LTAGWSDGSLCPSRTKNSSTGKWSSSSGWPLPPTDTWNVVSARSFFEMAVKDAKLPPIRLHDLRHTHVALLARAPPGELIQERVGHHSACFTLDNYGGTFPSHRHEAAKKFASLGASYLFC